MAVVDDIKSRLDIVEVVSRYTTLLRSGRSYKANCPFHQEKTPSFYVFPDRQSWRCFGACATGGDVFSFVMKAENLEFAETLRRLSQETGVALPNRERRDEQKWAVQINEAARDYFQSILVSPTGKIARTYLEQRGLSLQSIQEFELGLSPRDGESLKTHLLKSGFTVNQLAEAGVARMGDNDQCRDLFRGRLMIPIRNGAGELCGFGSRALDDSKPKYLNSPRSPIFDKGRILYALHRAREATRQKGIVIVEGYMDAIMAHQHGFNNVVASMGTALTEHQVAEVRRITGNITMSLDADAAGQQATLRSLESSWQVFQSQAVGKAKGTSLFQRQEIPDLKIAVLTDGKDPDEVIRHSPERWAEIVANATPLLEYLFTTLPSHLDTATPQGKARMAETMFPLITAVAEPAQQDYYFQKLAQQMGVSEETLQASIGRPRPTWRPGRNGAATLPPKTATPSAFARLERDPVEEYCLSLLLQHPEMAEFAGDLLPFYFKRMENRQIFQTWLESGAGPEINSNQILDNLRQRGEDGLIERMETLAQRTLPPLDRTNRSKAFQDTVRRLEERYLRELKSEEPPELLEVAPETILETNTRIKKNQSLRNSLNPSISPQRW